MTLLIKSTVRFRGLLIIQVISWLSKVLKKSILLNKPTLCEEVRLKFIRNKSNRNQLIFALEFKFVHVPCL